MCNVDSGESALLEESRKVMRHELDEHPCGKWETIAHDLKVDDSFLSKWTARGSNKDFFPLFRLVVWTKFVGPGLLRWVARKCGYEIVALHRHGHPSPTALVGLFARKSGSVLGHTLDDIASGGGWDDQEQHADLHGWMQVQTLVNGIVDGIQENLRRAS